MALWPSSPSVGDTYEEGGITYTCVQASPAKWRTASGIGPAVIVTELADSATYTPSDGMRYVEVHGRGGGDGEKFIKAYTRNEIGANAACVVGTEAALGTTSFTPAGDGAAASAAGQG